MSVPEDATHICQIRLGELDLSFYAKYTQDEDLVIKTDEDYNGFESNWKPIRIVFGSFGKSLIELDEIKIRKLINVK